MSALGILKSTGAVNALLGEQGLGPGLGTDTSLQLQSQLEERKKKLSGPLTLGENSPAVLQLFGSAR